MASKGTLIARLLLGLIFTAAGIAGLVMPQPTDLPEKMMLFNSGMAATGYFFQLLKGTEIVCGLLLLSGFYVPLALVILAPIAINILMVHIFMEPSGLPVAIAINAIMFYLSFMAQPYSKTIKILFQKK